MKNSILTILVLLYSLVAFSQKESRGDRFYNNGDYLNAIKEYAKQLNDGEASKHIFENIGTSYYNTFQFRKAYRALARLTGGKFKEKDKTYDNEFNFKMYQVLSALGEYDKALPYLEKYRSNNDQASIDNEIAMATIEAFKLKEEDFKIAPAKSLNSKSSEFGAVKIDSLVYFTSDRKSNGILDKNYRWTHRPFLNLYKAEVNKENVTKGEIVPFESVNSKLHEGNFCFSKDAKTIYISRSNLEKGRKKFDTLRKNPIYIYKSVKKDSAWSKPEKLVFNNINYSTQHPALSPDGKKLYFSSNMPGGQGGYDLYYVDVNADGTYGNPVNLGDVINTPNREQFPFVAKEGNLFFSSNGHLGLGMMDVFVAKVNGKQFEEPINLGAPINSSYDDFSFNYYDDSKGFFASNRNKISDEIYGFTQIGEVFLRPYNARFEARDMDTKEYIPGAKLSLFDKDEKEVNSFKIDTVSSKNIDIMPGRYTFKAEAPNYGTNEKPLWVKEKEEQTYVVFLKRNKEPEVKIQDPQEPIENGNPFATATPSTKPTPKSTTTPTNTVATVQTPKPSSDEIRKKLLEDKTGPPVTIRDGKMFFEIPYIYFDYDKWNIRDDSKKILDQLALKLDKFKTVYIKISSHTDSRGSTSYNQLLSERRAESTRNYLALVGYVNARRMEYAGFGESQLLIECGTSNVCTEDEHQTNRRSEFEIIKY